MKKLFYIFPLLALLLMTACEEELPETMGGIYGIVSNLETGEPVRGASVILSPGNQTTVTGYDGHFEFSIKRLKLTFQVLQKNMMEQH